MGCQVTGNRWETAVHLVLQQIGLNKLLCNSLQLLSWIVGRKRESIIIVMLNSNSYISQNLCSLLL